MDILALDAFACVCVSSVMKGNTFFKCQEGNALQNTESVKQTEQNCPQNF